MSISHPQEEERSESISWNSGSVLAKASSDPPNRAKTSKQETMVNIANTPFRRAGTTEVMGERSGKMRDGIALVSGIAVGLLGLWLWRLTVLCLGPRVFPQEFSQYNDLVLPAERASQRQQFSLTQRILLMPAAEEIAARAVPVALWLTGHWQCQIIGVIIWTVANWLWVQGHIWGSCPAGHCPHPQTQWLPNALRHLQQITFWGYAVAYTASWATAGLGVPPRTSVHSLAAPLVWGFLAATIAHGMHNLLILDAGPAGRCYRRSRGIHHDQPNGPIE